MNTPTALQIQWAIANLLVGRPADYDLSSSPLSAPMPPPRYIDRDSDRA